MRTVDLRPGRNNATKPSPSTPFLISEIHRRHRAMEFKELSMRQFSTLVRIMTARGGQQSGTGRPWGVPAPPTASPPNGNHSC
jgi:hypothetical protein